MFFVASLTSHPIKFSNAPRYDDPLHEPLADEEEGHRQLAGHLLRQNAVQHQASFYFLSQH